MKQSLYVIYDYCAKVSMPPFSSPNDETAKRDFVIGSIMAQKPIQDLQLWRVAEISAPDGIVEGFLPVLRESRELLNPTVSEIAEYKEAFKDFLPNLNLDIQKTDFGMESNEEVVDE